MMRYILLLAMIQSAVFLNSAAAFDVYSKLWEDNLEHNGSSALYPKHNISPYRIKNAPRNYSPEKAAQEQLGNHAFCYIDDQGQVQGTNVDKKLSIASVSKVFTSLWALSKKGGNTQFVTKVYTDGTDMHIEGGDDPIFARRSLYLLINKLNDKNITKINTLTFSSNFYFTPQAIDNTTHAHVYDIGDTHYCNPYEPRPAKNKVKNGAKRKRYSDNERGMDLLRYFNTASWDNQRLKVSKSSRAKYQNKCLNTKLQKTILADYRSKKSIFNYTYNNPLFRVSNVSMNDKNPFKKKNGDILPGTHVFTYKSQPLWRILKFINIVSANQPSDLLFSILGGIKQFKKDFGIMLSNDNESDIEFISGSGLPIKRKKISSTFFQRQNNRATCRAVLSTLELLLKYNNEKYDPAFNPRETNFTPPSDTIYMDIPSKYIAVGGIEMNKRFGRTYPGNYFIAKTGTIGVASSLVGTIHQSGEKLRHFAMINNYPNRFYPSIVSNTRTVQNLMMNDLMRHLGKKTFDYRPNGSNRRKSFTPHGGEVEYKYFQYGNN